MAQPVILCKCGYRPPNPPNPYYAVINDNSTGASLISEYQQKEVGFQIIGHFASSDEADEYARERGMQFP